MIDDHNHLRHLLLSIEEIFNTNHWKNRGFRFIISVFQVNTKHSKDFFTRGSGSDEDSIYQFRYKLAIGLINNPCIINGYAKARKSRRIYHR